MNNSESSNLPEADPDTDCAVVVACKEAQDNEGCPLIQALLPLHPCSWKVDAWVTP